MQTTFGRAPKNLVVALTVLMLALAACSSGTSSPTAIASSDGGASTPPGGSAQLDPSEKLPNAAGELKSVKIAQSIPSLSFSPLLVALDRNFFGNQGLKVDFVELQSGTTGLQALIGGSVDLVASSSDVTAGAVAKGSDVQAIENIAMMTLQLCVRKDWASKANVTPDSPLEDRIKALKGATLGITGPGASSDRDLRYLLIKLGGLDANTDTTITQVGGASAMAGALDANQIQGFLLSPPNCASTKEGEVLVEPSDVPTFKNYVFEVLLGSTAWLKKNADIASKAATAMAMGNNYIVEYPDEALKILQAQFSKVDPSIIENAFQKTILPQIKKNGQFDADMWNNTNTVLLDAGVISQPLPMDEGKIWTNEYIHDPSLPYK